MAFIDRRAVGRRQGGRVDHILGPEGNAMQQPLRFFAVAGFRLPEHERLVDAGQGAYLGLPQPDARKAGLRTFDRADSLLADRGDGDRGGKDITTWLRPDRRLSSTRT